MTFFLIDDDEDDRELFELALNDVGADVRFMSASGCQEALRLITSSGELPNYIFLDLNMPGMNGKDCLCYLKQRDDLRHVPVIIFSTSGDPLDIQATKAMGAVGFITKPSKTSELTRLLANFINQTTHA